MVKRARWHSWTCKVLLGRDPACDRCYGDWTNEPHAWERERRPRTMRAAYAQLSPRQRGLMLRRRM